jgi:hypothetical protein
MADAEVIPESAPSNPQEAPLAYQLKWISWKDDVFIPVITQNRNGPCPIIALCNVLTFKRKIRIPPGNSAIHSDELAQLLADHILSAKPTVRFHFRSLPRFFYANNSSLKSGIDYIGCVRVLFCVLFGL